MSQDSATSTQSISRHAFELVKAEIEAVKEADFLAVTLDIPATVITVQGAYPEIVAQRPQFVQHLPTFDVSRVDKLETYALAMYCAQADYKAAIAPPADLAELAHSAVQTRTILLADVNSLIAHGLLTENVLDGLQGVNGYKNLMMDLGTLASILRANEAKVADRTSVRPDELSAAEDLANKFGKAIGSRAQSPEVIADAARNRQAAYTLFVKTYEQVRTAIQYLRHDQGDADEIAPSLFANRGARKKATEQNADVSPAPAPAPVAPHTTNVVSSPVANPSNTEPNKASIAAVGPFVQ